MRVSVITDDLGLSGLLDVVLDGLAEAPADANQAPDLVIVDATGTSREPLADIARARNASNVLIILALVNDDAERQAEVYRAGADTVVNVPFHPRALAQVCRTLAAEPPVVRRAARAMHGAVV